MKIFKLFFFLISVVAFAGCSDNDEPEIPDAQAKQIYETVVSKMYNQQTKTPVFTASNVEDVYMAVAEDAAKSQAFCEKIICGAWNGKDTYINLGAYGSVKVFETNESLSTDGIYNKMYVNVKDYEPFTLLIFDRERANGDNGYSGGGVAIIDVETIYSE